MSTAGNDFADALAAAIADRLRPMIGERRTSERRLLSQKEAAKYLGVSIRTLQVWISEGRIPVVEIGERKQLDITALDRLIEQRTATL